VNGRSVGRVTELRDHSNFFEQRSALTEGTLGDGGSLVPVGYVPEVLHAAKRTDQVLEAGNWDLAATVTGGPLNIPSSRLHLTRCCLSCLAMGWNGT